MVWNNVRAAEELRTFIRVDGIIGNKLWNDFSILIDYHNATLRLARMPCSPSQMGANVWPKVAYEHTNVGIVLACKIDGLTENLHLCLDTGASVIERGRASSVLNASVAARMLVAGETHFSSTLVIGGINFGAESFKLKEFKGVPVDGFLGNSFLMKHKVLIVFAERVLYIKTEEER